MHVEKRLQLADKFCEAIAASIHFPSHLAGKWLAKYGYLMPHVSKPEVGLRPQLCRDYRDSYNEMVNFSETANGKKAVLRAPGKSL